MSLRGYNPPLDANGDPIYEQFIIDSYETVRVTVQESIDGADFTVVDVSASTTKVYYRASIKGSATVAFSTELTDVTDGTDGKVSADVVHRRSDFTNGIGEGASEVVEGAIVLVNETVADAETPSTYKEKVIHLWPVTLLGEMNNA